MKKGRKKGVEANEKSPKTLINKGDVKIYEIRYCRFTKRRKKYIV